MHSGTQKQGDNYSNCDRQIDIDTSMPYCRLWCYICLLLLFHHAVKCRLNSVFVWQTNVSVTVRCSLFTTLQRRWFAVVSVITTEQSAVTITLIFEVKILMCVFHYFSIFSSFLLCISRGVKNYGAGGCGPLNAGGPLCTAQPAQPIATPLAFVYSRPEKQKIGRILFADVNTAVRALSKTLIIWRHSYKGRVPVTNVWSPAIAENPRDACVSVAPFPTTSRKSWDLVDVQMTTGMEILEVVWPPVPMTFNKFCY